MKRIFIYSASLFVMAAFVTLIFGSITKTRNQSTRSDYESYLTQLSQEFDKRNNSTESTEPGLDQPDAAAFFEFVKTVDPETKTVPIEKRLVAMQETDRLLSLKTYNSSINWTSRIADRGGRTRVIMFDPNDANGTGMYAGAVTGGLWYTSNALEGDEWQIIDDFWPNLAISSMAYDPNNPANLYVGTGESQTALKMYRESSGRGLGVYRSTDAGAHWEIIPSTSDWAYVTDLVVRGEDGHSVIYAGVASGLYKGSTHLSDPSDGLYRSIDGGDTWSQVLPDVPGLNSPYVPSDIILSPDSKRMYVGTSYGISQNSSENTRTGAACILFSDDGIEWTSNRDYNEAILQNPNINLPGRVMLATASSSPDIVYAIVASGYKNGTYHVYGCEFLLRSNDRGETWTELNFPYGFASLAWHAFAVDINPQDPDIIWLGGLDTWRSTDGGENWMHMSDWTGMYQNGKKNYVHGDIHQFLHRPNNGREMYIATDGGVFVTGSSTSPDNVVFHERNRSFNTLQYYSCDISPINGRDHFIGGMQDNGTMQYIPDKIPTYLDRLSGGDGAYCFFDQDEPDMVISSSQSTGLYLYQINNDFSLNYQYGELHNLGIFINPMDYDWKNNKLYVNGCASNGFGTNNIGIADVDNQTISGILMEVPTNTLVPFSTVKWDETHIGNESIIFLGTQSGLIYRLVNPAASCEVNEISGNQIPNAYISSIETGQTSDTLLVTLSNYGVASVWVTTDAGTTWKDIEGNLPDMPVRWGLFHPASSKHIMLATETGTWTCDDAWAEDVVWRPEINGMANVRVDMLRIRKSDNTVLAASHGRGLFTTIWELKNTSGLDDQVLSQKFECFPNPTNGKFTLAYSIQDKADLTIHDAIGRLVLHEEIQAGNLSRPVNLESESKGIYYIQIQTKSETYNQKIILH